MIIQKKFSYSIKKPFVYILLIFQQRFYNEIFRKSGLSSAINSNFYFNLAAYNHKLLTPIDIIQIAGIPP